mgnify:CR=1 FL=1|tara:strand:+ start:2527 stop:5304 length:2778 start_codon:yes stop_codon:yes gene_type:complete
MNRQTRTKTEGTLLHAAKMAAVLSVAATLFACDGANQGVQIGNGQTPDPVVIDFPIAYIKTPVPVDDNGAFMQTDLREQITFDVGGDLFYKDRASPSALAVNITGRITEGNGAVRDVEMAYDGSAVLFAMRTPFDPNLDDEDQVTWNLWEYTFADDELRRIITSDLTAEIGHDIMPKYLPDGRIIFASTRQTRSQAILLDEGKPGFPAMDEDQNEYAFNLHVINRDGSGIEQISFNQSHDLDPAVLADGTIVFSRWDHAGPGNDQVNLYRMNPDGSNLELLYGNESHDTGANGETIQFMQPRQAEDGRVFSLVRPFADTEGGGEVIVIDTAQYVENTQPLAANIGILNGPAQEDATVNEVLTIPGVPSPGGRYYSVYPIQDGSTRMLVSWSQCRLIEAGVDADPATMEIEPLIVPCTDERLANVFVVDPNNIVPIPDGMFTVAPPLYGIWIYDPRDNTQQPVVPGEEGFMFTEVVSADPRPTPPVVLDGSNDFALDDTLAANGEAVLKIRSVYDFDGGAVANIPALADPTVTPAEDRPARFLRIEKAVSIPDDDLLDIDNTAFGVSTANGMKEIVGYAMIEPDGSVITKIPANTALMLSVLDENGKRITARHNNWLSARPGQEIECNGCHVANSGVSHGRKDAFDSAWAGAALAGVEFPNTNPAWFVGDVGDTMAETRARITCANDACSSIQPSMDVVYRDVWTIPPDPLDPNAQQPAADIDYLYTDLTTPPPVPVACLQSWQASCRAVINYETNIHPLWSQPRLVFDETVDPPVPVLDANGVQLSNNCLNCHSPIDPADGVTVRVPAGQLELQDGISPDEPAHFHAYRELLVTDNLQEVVNGALVDAQQQVGVDDDGNPIFDVIPIAPPARTAGALASGDFFNRFEDPNDLHYNILSPSERRLIAEWLDVGAQYYNNPFDAPVN